MANKFILEKYNLATTLEAHGFAANSKAWVSTETGNINCFFVFNFEGVSSEEINGYAGGMTLEQNYLAKMPLLAMANSIAQVHWFSLYDGNGDSPYGHMGLYYNIAGETVDSADMKECAKALRTFTGIGVDKMQYDSELSAELRESLTGEITGVQLYAFSNDTHKILAAWVSTIPSGEEDVDDQTVQIASPNGLVQYKWDWSDTQDVYGA